MNVCRECLSGLMCSYFCMTYNGYKVEKVEEEVRIGQRFLCKQTRIAWNISPSQIYPN
jgi:hypothetical protein